MTKKKKMKLVQLNLQFPAQLLRLVAITAEKHKDKFLANNCRENAMVMRFVLCTQQNKKSGFRQLYWVKQSDWNKFVKEENKRLKDGTL